MTTDLVSVVVATYRREADLVRALESLKSQSYSVLEVVVVDDNFDGKWNTIVKNIVKQFKKDSKLNIKYIKNETQCGSAKAPNLGIENSSGKYITFLDDDDVYLADKIKNQLKVMQDCNADYSVTDLSLYNEKNKFIEKRDRSYIKSTKKEDLLKYHLMYHITGTDTLMFKKEYLLKIGCFTLIDVGDEFYLVHKAINGEGKFVYVPVCDVKAYIHTETDGLSSGLGKIKGENLLYEYKKGFFKSIDKKSVRYIKVRHHAVLAFAYLRMKKYVKFVVESIKAVLISPISAFKLLSKR